MNKLFESDMGWGIIDGMRIPLTDYNTEQLTLSTNAGETLLTVPTLVGCGEGFSGTADVMRLLDTVSTSYITKFGNISMKSIVTGSLMI